jgi:hypothetical protein
LHNYYEIYDEQNPGRNSVHLNTGGSHIFNARGVLAGTLDSGDDYTYSAYNRYGKAGIDFSLMEGKPAYTYQYDEEGYENGDTITKHFAFEEDLMGASEFDIVITSEEEFKKYVYMLHPNKNEDGSIDLTTKGEPNSDFNYRYILVRDIDFTENLGSSDLDLAVLQPSIRYIKFDNCQWHCQWYLSGEEPTELQPNQSGTPTEYKPANGPLSVVLDGINISEDNINSGLEPDKYYIGLRNFERIENCFINYPDDYELLLREDGEYRYSFKFNLQYFNTVQNCKVTALWDGSNISGCRISERVVRCNNCNNILAEPVYRNGVLYRVQMRQSKNLSNIYGSPVIYTDCDNIDRDTCSGYTLQVVPDEFDTVITSEAQFRALASNTDAINVLVTGFAITEKYTVPGFFDNTINDTNIAYFTPFILPKNVRYIKFSKNFYYNTARAIIQGHPDCIIDGFPTISAPYNYSHSATLYDFKEVRNCYARGINSYDENGALVEKLQTIGISNRIKNAPNEQTYPELACKYNYKRTRFINCDISYIEDAEGVIDCRIINTSNSGFNSMLVNVSNINNLKILRIYGSLALDNCKFISNVNSGGYSINYNNCLNVDTLTCDKAPNYLSPYREKLSISNYYNAVALYVQDQNGNETSKLAREASGGGFIPVRTGTGDLLVPETPSVGGAAASKKFVEKQVEDAKEYMHQMDNMLINNLTDDIDRLYASKDYVDDAIANLDIPEGGSSESSFDIIITSQEQFLSYSTNDFRDKSILVKNTDLLLPSIDFGFAKYVEFSNVYVGSEYGSFGIHNFHHGNFIGLTSGVKEIGTDTYDCDNMGIYNFDFVENVKPYAWEKDSPTYNEVYYCYGRGMLNCDVTGAQECTNIINCYGIGRRAVYITNCQTISNFYGQYYTFDLVFENCSHISNVVWNSDKNITYDSCLMIDPDTCDGYKGGSSVEGSFDIIITSREQFLSSNLRNKKVLIKDTTLLLAEIDCKGAKYVEFCNVDASADTGFNVTIKNFERGNFMGLYAYSINIDDT